MVKYVISICSVFFLMISCKKKDVEYNIPNISNGNVEFYFYGKINSLPIYIEAGKDNYYMFSGITYDTTIHTYLFEGEFKKTNCTYCSDVLKISIVDDTIIPYGYPSHIQKLNIGNYAFYAPSSSTTGLSMNLYAIPLNPSVVATYQYYLDGNLIGNIANLTNYFITSTTHTLTCIMNNYTDSCMNNTLTNILNFTPTDDFYAYFLYSINTYSNSKIVTFTINTFPSTSHTYTLEFGDSSYSVTSNSIQTHFYPDHTTLYLARLKAKSDNGKIWTFQNYVTFNPNLINCLPNYYYTFSSFTNTVSPYSKIKIQYVSSENKTYTSFSFIQPLDSYFQIVSIQPYKHNSQNMPTKKITAKFKCRLYNTNNPGDYIDIEGDCQFAVAYL